MSATYPHHRASVIHPPPTPTLLWLNRAHAPRVNTLPTPWNSPQRYSRQQKTIKPAFKSGYITYFANSRINIFKSICNCNQELRGDLLVLNYTKLILGPMIQIASMWCHTEQGNTQSCLPPCTMHHRFAPYLPIMHHVSPNIFFSQQNVCKAEHHKHASLIDSQTFSVFHTSFSGEGLQGPIALCLNKSLHVPEKACHSISSGKFSNRL